MLHFQIHPFKTIPALEQLKTSIIRSTSCFGTASNSAFCWLKNAFIIPGSGICCVALISITEGTFGENRSNWHWLDSEWNYRQNFQQKYCSFLTLLHCHIKLSHSWGKQRTYTWFVSTSECLLLELFNLEKKITEGSSVVICLWLPRKNNSLILYCWFLMARSCTLLNNSRFK